MRYATYVKESFAHVWMGRSHMCEWAMSYVLTFICDVCVIHTHICVRIYISDTHKYIKRHLTCVNDIWHGSFTHVWMRHSRICGWFIHTCDVPRYIYIYISHICTYARMTWLIRTCVNKPRHWSVSIHIWTRHVTYMGWLWLVGSLQILVSFAEYSLFYIGLFCKRDLCFKGAY